jgi:hypothetical protein
MLVHLYLDSSCFRSETARDAGALQTLQHLVDEGAVKVYVHEL